MTMLFAMSVAIARRSRSPSNAEQVETSGDMVIFNAKGNAVKDTAVVYPYLPLRPVPNIGERCVSVCAGDNSVQGKHLDIWCQVLIQRGHSFITL